MPGHSDANHPVEINNPYGEYGKKANTGSLPRRSHNDFSKSEASKLVEGGMATVSGGALAKSTAQKLDAFIN